MSYTKHNYKKGDELLASQLNEMDDQIALNEENINSVENTVNELDSSVNVLEPAATSSDVGKFLKVKTVANGKTSQYEFATPQVATDAQVSSAVNTWLGNNIAQETGYALDRTLLIANAAAPADLVGDIYKRTTNIENDLYARSEQIGTVLQTTANTTSASLITDSAMVIEHTGKNIF